MIDGLYQKYLQSTGITTDTRKLAEGNIFFALKGPRFNANEFAKEALDKGASYVVVDDESVPKNPRVILVDDSLKTLQKMASLHRSKLKIPVIGLTGSNGKTTTKELINAVLSRKYKSLATRGNLNNHIGVPITLLEIANDTEIAIIEMGANKVGDIQELCRIAAPSHGLITNIGHAHIEGFGSYEGVLRGKSEIFEWIRKHGGTVFINSTDPVLFSMAKRFENPILYPGKNDFYHCELVEKIPFIRMKTENGNLITTQLIGSYNFINAATALCLGKFFGVSPESAKQAIETYIPDNNRSQIIKKGSNTIIMDAYNANPSSMEAALKHLNDLSAENKIAILGDMFELGSFKEEGHRKIGKLTKQMNLKLVILCGENMKSAFEQNKNARYFRNLEELEGFLKNYSFKNTTILIKGSRAMELENILDKIKLLP
jgi:UDP-N-acetylmuramoyl-tripeptide--D-alanyl-D-alanine ligase